MKNTLFGIVAIGVFVGCIFLWYFIATIFTCKTTSPFPSNEITKLKNERDSLKALSEQSVAREQVYIIRIEQDSLKALRLQEIISYRESKIKSYQERLKEISKLTIAKPDSFLIKRYAHE